MGKLLDEVNWYMFPLPLPEVAPQPLPLPRRPLPTPTRVPVHRPPLGMHRGTAPRALLCVCPAAPYSCGTLTVIHTPKKLCVTKSSVDVDRSAWCIPTHPCTYVVGLDPESGCVQHGGGSRGSSRKLELLPRLGRPDPFLPGTSRDYCRWSLPPPRSREAHVDQQGTRRFFILAPWATEAVQCWRCWFAASCDHLVMVSCRQWGADLVVCFGVRGVGHTCHSARGIYIAGHSLVVRCDPLQSCSGLPCCRVLIIKTSHSRHCQRVSPCCTDWCGSRSFRHGRCLGYTTGRPRFARPRSSVSRVLLVGKGAAVGAVTRLGGASPSAIHVHLQATKDWWRGHISPGAVGLCELLRAPLH